MSVRFTLLYLAVIRTRSDAVHGYTAVPISMIIRFWSLPPHPLSPIRQLVFVRIVLIIVDTETMITCCWSRNEHLPDTLLDSLMEVELNGEVARPSEGRHGREGIM